VVVPVRLGTCLSALLATWLATNPTGRGRWVMRWTSGVARVQVVCYLPGQGARHVAKRDYCAVSSVASRDVPLAQSLAWTGSSGCAAHGGRCHPLRREW
jgi:hypothetical protein